MNFELTDETAERLRHLLAHPAWHEFFVARLDQWRDDAVASLLDPSESRRQNTSDDYLRAQVAVIDSLKRVGLAELNAWDAGTAEEAERKKIEQAYDNAADLGVYRPQP